MPRLTKLIACLFALGIASFAQTITGSISGRIIDQQQAAIANATITATDPAKGTSSSTKSAANGEFLIAGLFPGTFVVTVEATGFKKLTHTDIVLNANDKLAIGDMVVQVGAVTDSVEVNAQAVLLQTESAERSDSVVGKQVENIEVNGRNPLDMVKLVPGVQMTTGANLRGRQLVQWRE